MRLGDGHAHEPGRRQRLDIGNRIGLGAVELGCPGGDDVPGELAGARLERSLGRGEVGGGCWHAVLALFNGFVMMASAW